MKPIYVAVCIALLSMLAGCKGGKELATHQPVSREVRNNFETLMASYPEWTTFSAKGSASPMTRSPARWPKWISSSLCVTKATIFISLLLHQAAPPWGRAVDSYRYLKYSPSVERTLSVAGSVTLYDSRLL